MSGTTSCHSGEAKADRKTRKQKWMGVETGTRERGFTGSGLERIWGFWRKKKMKKRTHAGNVFQTIIVMLEFAQLTFILWQISEYLYIQFTFNKKRDPIIFLKKGVNVHLSERPATPWPQTENQTGLENGSMTLGWNWISFRINVFIVTLMLSDFFTTRITKFATLCNISTELTDVWHKVDVCLLLTPHFFHTVTFLLVKQQQLVVRNEFGF